MVRSFSILLPAVLLFSGLAQADTLFNAGFESGALSPWTQGINGSSGFYTGTSWAVSGAAARTGSYGAVADGNHQLRQNFTGVNSSDVTEFSFWLRRPNADPITNGNDNSLVTFYYSDSTMSWGVGTLTGSDWTQFNFTSSITPGKTLVGIDTWGYVDGAGSNFITYVDDFVLTLSTDPVTDPVPEPSSFALLATGILGLAMVRRRRGRLGRAIH